jgi:hypothetical protein
MDAPCPRAARLVIVRDLQTGEDPRTQRNTHGWEFVVHRPNFLRRGNLLHQGGLLHDLEVPAVRSSSEPPPLKTKADTLFLVLGVILSNFVPKFVKGDLGGCVFTDSAVPRRAVSGTLRSEVCLDSVLLVHSTFLPNVGGLEQFARYRNNLLVRW